MCPSYRTRAGYKTKDGRDMNAGKCIFQHTGSHCEYSSIGATPAALNAHSTASLRSQKYCRIQVLIISMAVTAELLLQMLSCRDHLVSCQEVSGKRSRKHGSNDDGPATRFCSISPVCTRLTIPDAMLIMAMKLGFDTCVVMKVDAASGSSWEENDPGIIRISNWGAFSNEF